MSAEELRMVFGADTYRAHARMPTSSTEDSDVRESTDFDVELIEHRTLDCHTQELIYRPTLHAGKYGERRPTRGVPNHRR
ncbi:hypothetical protein ACFQ07_03900 [Actinomadura adrarensis]|uniref:UTRA domain-containing protein n=1 Tax=Actinomadura adrarensis TaxID=1819600 RepID=A0ABW3CCI7_9ACTN